MGKSKVAFHLLTALFVLACVPPAVTGAFAQRRASAVPRRPQEQRQFPPQQRTPYVWCKDNKQLNLTGKYQGVYFLGKDDREGTPATFQVDGNSFLLVSDNLKGGGTITAVNSCGDTSVALRFERATGEERAGMEDLLGSMISLDARRVGAPEATMGNVQTLDANQPIVLATSFDRQGKLAGPDFAFVICPPYPACKKYPKCPCPEPK